MPLLEMLDKLITVLQDGDGILTSDQLGKAINEAVLTYAKYRPRRTVVDIAGSGAFDYALPVGFDVERSTIETIEFPAGSREPEMLVASGWRLYQGPGGTQLRFLSVTPATGQSARVTFTTPHSVTQSSSTIPLTDEDAVTNQAAALACGWLAAHYSQAGEPTLSAEVAHHETKARHYREQAKLFHSLFTDYLGIGADGQDSGVVAASVIQTAQTTYPWGEARLTHRRYV